MSLEKPHNQNSLTSREDPSAEQRWNATSIFDVNIYDFMCDAYNGTGGFRDGRYLVPHDREVFFDARRQSSFYKNFVKPIVRATFEPCFVEQRSRVVQDENKREITGQPINGFLGDVDAAGMTIQEFAREAVKMARLHGVSFIVMDNFPESEQPGVVVDVLATRTYPYAYLKKAQEFVVAEISTMGTLISITFAEPEEVVISNGRVEKHQVRRRFGSYMTEKLMRDNHGNWVVVEEIPNALGYPPVVILYDGTHSLRNGVLIDPPLYDIARINHGIYNKDSEIRDQERAQGFAVFYLQTSDRGNLSLGTKNVLFVDPEATIPPGFASPNPAILEGLMKNAEQLRQDLYGIAEQNGIKGVQSSKSGVALQWEFFAHESVLKASSAMARKVETEMVWLFGQYEGKTYVYSVDYPDDFQPNNVEAEAGVLMDSLERVDWPPRARSSLKAKLYRLLTPDITPEIIAEAVAEIEQSGEDADRT